MTDITFNDFIFIGFNQVPTDNCRVYQILVRPDVSEELILAVSHQVLLSSSGVVCRKVQFEPLPSIQSPILEAVPQSSASTAHSVWSTIRIYLGVNDHFQRSCVLCILPSTANVANSKHFLDFTCNLANCLVQAMRHESLTLEYLPVELYNESSTKVMSIETLLDFDFLRDLQAASAKSMFIRLMEQVNKLDHRLKMVELQGGRLMTLLKPTYKRASMEFPKPTASLPLTSYPLLLTYNSGAIGGNNSITEYSLDSSKLILLRARKRYRQLITGSSTINKSHTNSLQMEPSQQLQQHNQHNQTEATQQQQHHTTTEVAMVLQFVIEAFTEWAECEYNQRLYRKVQWVKDKLDIYYQFQLKLIITLHQRFLSYNNNNKNNNNGITAADEMHMRSVRERFPFLDYREPVLFECNVALNGGQRHGTLYITVGYILFYATTNISGSITAGLSFLLSNSTTTNSSSCSSSSSVDSIIVIPLHTIDFIELWNSHHSTTTTYQYYPHHDELSHRSRAILNNSSSNEDNIRDNKNSANSKTAATTRTKTVTVVSNTSNTSYNSVGSAGTAHRLMLGGSCVLRIVDCDNNKDIVLEVKGQPLPDYSDRVADLLDLLIKEKMYLTTSTRTTTTAISTVLPTATTIDNLKQQPHQQQRGDIDTTTTAIAITTTVPASNLVSSNTTTISFANKTISCNNSSNNTPAPSSVLNSQQTTFTNNNNAIITDLCDNNHNNIDQRPTDIISTTTNSVSNTTSSSTSVDIISPQSSCRLSAAAIYRSITDIDDIMDLLAMSDNSSSSSSISNGTTTNNNTNSSSTTLINDEGSDCDGGMVGTNKSTKAMTTLIVNTTNYDINTLRSTNNNNTTTTTANSSTATSDEIAQQLIQLDDFFNATTTTTIVTDGTTSNSISSNTVENQTSTVSSDNFSSSVRKDTDIITNSSSDNDDGRNIDSLLIQTPNHSNEYVSAKPVPVVVAPKKSLGNNIQKFLAKSQGKLTN